MLFWEMLDKRTILGRPDENSYKNNKWRRILEYPYKRTYSCNFSKFDYFIFRAYMEKWPE
jgi:hypothetical protein